MKKPAASTIKRWLRELRKQVIEKPTVPEIELRIAQAMEFAIRKVTEGTCGWPTPVDEVFLISKIIRQSLQEATK